MPLEEQENQQRGRDDQQGTSAQQCDVRAVLTLERAQAAGDGTHGRVVDEHERQQVLVPGREEEQDRERRQCGHRERKLHLAEDLPRCGAVELGGLGQRCLHPEEARPHPEHPEGHEQPDERQDKPI